MPNPGSSGRNSNFPNDEVDSSIITFSGFWNANIAITVNLKDYYFEYNSTMSCSLDVLGNLFTFGLLQELAAHRGVVPLNQA